MNEIVIGTTAATRWQHIPLCERSTLSGGHDATGSSHGEVKMVTHPHTRDICGAIVNDTKRHQLQDSQCHLVVSLA